MRGVYDCLFRDSFCLLEGRQIIVWRISLGSGNFSVGKCRFGPQLSTHEPNSGSQDCVIVV